jgi:predicted RecB family nuclease
MREEQGVRLYAATDLVNFLGCGHATFLDLRQLTDPAVPPAEDDEQLALLREKGFEHERSFLERLRAEGRGIVEIPAEAGLGERVAATRQAMLDGVEVIYQGALLSAPWHGFSDFLLRVDGVASRLGSYTYDVADTKLARTATPKHVIQLCVYAELLEEVQGQAPPRMHVVLGNGVTVSLRTADIRHYYGVARRRFEAFAAAPPAASLAEPCGHCGVCRWRGRCEEVWDASEHLSLVAGITRAQTNKLRLGGIPTIRSLAAAPEAPCVAGMQTETFGRLRSQAGLQLVRRDFGQGRTEVLPIEEGRGFCRLPQPTPGDIFFDMEGDPFIEGGLEYLFGMVWQDGGETRYRAFWAHGREAEREAFEAAVDLMQVRMAEDPGAHIYHYGNYEPAALKRLAMCHGTREAEVDQFLRRGAQVDLYKVVREGVRISEPGYSLKNLEAFYMPQARSGEVTTAGGSIVTYERWRRLGDGALLEEIAQYNEVDCRSAQLCRDWLLSLRPEAAPWFIGPPGFAGKPGNEQKRQEAEARTEELMAALTSAAPAAEREWWELLGCLLEFHRREAKPTWWATFTRQEMSEEELIDNAECIGGLRPDPSAPPWPEKRSVVYSFTFPPQDFKMRVGDTPVRPGTLEPAGEIISLDEQAGRIALKLGPSRTPLGDEASLIPQGPIGDKVLRDAIHRFASAVAKGAVARYGALADILQRRAPRLRNRADGEAIVPEGTDALAGMQAALDLLMGSYLLVQGPPGSGKTFCSGRAIATLLAGGKRIGVASHSHKAINNLLKDVEEAAVDRGLQFRGIKKSSVEEQFFSGCGLVGDTLENEVACGAEFQLVAGTAWLFARDELDQAFDYLFVDEAGQVSLANLVAMGVSARNIVLVGDQMQLSQPLQGAHPGGSGVSAMEQLLAGQAMVPADRGIFLAKTRRMHPDICQFVSDAVYDGRLVPAPNTEKQRLILDAAAVPEALAATGIRFVYVEHEGCAQKSLPEARRLKTAYEALLGQHWINEDAVAHAIGTEDILVVTPYNMQVNLLQSLLPAGARVGTVDKFQGQEAAAVLISMATSSGEDLPRNIEFLYSRNRLNVAISRARCLAVIFASPRLLEVPCATIEQMQLVNTLCWAKDYSDELCRRAATVRPDAPSAQKVPPRSDGCWAFSICRRQ